jgi:hypothetical protein
MTTALLGAGPNTPPRNDDGRGAHRHRDRRAWFALAAVVLAVAGLAQTRPGRDAMSSLGLSSAADRYTALSFTTPDGLGQQTGADQISASFAIANHEGADRNYRWTVTVGEGDRGRPVIEGATQVADGSTGIVRPAVPNPCPTADAAVAPTRERITVSLSDPSQSIGFWLTCANAGAPS